MLLNSVLDTVGSAPLIRLKKMSSGNVFVKAEHLNPGGSIKDRVAKNIIESAEREGKLKSGMVIIEATSGNTGIGLSLVGRQKGYKVVCVMPENMSEERKKIILAFGGEIDIFIAGVGSGGTLQGVGKFLKEKKPDVKIVAVEPKNCSALLGREPGLHRIQGIGDGFIPDVLDVNLVDMVFTVSDEEAIETTRRLSHEEGLLVGTSSGANVFAALHMDNGRNKVVTILPDRAERYFSTALL